MIKGIHHCMAFVRYLEALLVSDDDENTLVNTKSPGELYLEIGMELHYKSWLFSKVF
jgi:hypothetical protein